MRPPYNDYINAKVNISTQMLGYLILKLNKTVKKWNSQHLATYYSPLQAESPVICSEVGKKYVTHASEAGKRPK